MTIVVSDTNIFIDLWAIGLLNELFELGVSVHTTDFVVAELKKPEQAAFVRKASEDGRLTVKTFEASRIPFIADLLEGNLSMADGSVLLYALEGGYTLLTGDRRLRRAAEEHGLEVRGVLYVVEQMYTRGVITKETYKERLQKLLLTNRRLPGKEIMRILDSLV